SFGIMAAILNEFENSLESTAHMEEQQDNASWALYLERRSLVLQFLRSSLSLHQLQHYQNKADLLKKCCFYLGVEPKYMNVTDENHVMHRTDILQLIDPCKLQRMKELGKKQTEIQLSLLTELLEQLERGRAELSHYVETWDMATFLSQWHLITQRLSELSELSKTVISLQVPGELYVQQSLVSHALLRGTRLPNIRLSLYTKMPLIFNRNKSFAYKDWVRLQWFTNNKEPHFEQYELHCKLLTDGVGYSRIQEVTSNICIVQGLQPGRSYQFTIRRSYTRTFVFANWHDSIILKTQANTVEDAESSA
ncbi:Uncharacterized protein C20orf195, partial [Cariama cristata]